MDRIYSVLGYRLTNDAANYFIIRDLHGVRVCAFIEWDLEAGDNEDRMDRRSYEPLQSSDEESQVLIKSTNGEECNTMFDRTFKLL